MSIFNFRKRDFEPVSEDIFSTNGHAVEPFNLPEIDESIFIDKNPSKTNGNVVDEGNNINNGNIRPNQYIQSDNNIALLYAFLDKNYERKGYDDALLNPDTSHLNQNIDALRSDLIRTINKVKTFYQDFILEIDYHILSRGRSGMVDIVEELEMKKGIALNHFEKVRVLEDDTKNNEGDCKGILISYTRGFKNGLAAISHHNILTKRF